MHANQICLCLFMNHQTVTCHSKIQNFDNGENHLSIPSDGGWDYWTLPWCTVNDNPTLWEYSLPSSTVDNKPTLL